MLADFAQRCANAAIFIGLGFCLEAVWSQRRVPAPSARLNMLCVILVWFVNVTAGGFFAMGIASLVVTLPGHGLLHPLMATGTLLGNLATVVVWLALIDFFYYWQHRAQHAWTWLWAEHELHHSDEHVNVTTAWRNHWLELPLQSLTISAPVVYLFGAELGQVFLMHVLADTFAVFTHLNAPISFGKRNWWLANPQTHRIHHSIEPQHRDKNFAVIFPIWDVIFGTYYAPAKGEYPPTGLASGEQVQTVWRAATLPFSRWRQLLGW